MTLRRTHRNRSLNSPGYMPVDALNIKSCALFVNVQAEKRGKAHA